MRQRQQRVGILAFIKRCVSRKNDAGCPILAARQGWDTSNLERPRSEGGSEASRRTRFSVVNPKLSSPPLAQLPPPASPAAVQPTQPAPRPPPLTRHWPIERSITPTAPLGCVG